MQNKYKIIGALVSGAIVALCSFACMADYIAPIQWNETDSGLICVQCHNNGFESFDCNDAIEDVDAVFDCSQTATCETTCSKATDCGQITGQACYCDGSICYPSADSDQDGDGTPDNDDDSPWGEDQDGDGIPEALDPYPSDSDNDGIPADTDPDDDNDGITDTQEITCASYVGKYVSYSGANATYDVSVSSTDTSTDAIFSGDFYPSQCAVSYVDDMCVGVLRRGTDHGGINLGAGFMSIEKANAQCGNLVMLSYVFGSDTKVISAYPMNIGKGQHYCMLITSEGTQYYLGAYCK